jgi:hypothetical protein
MTTQPQSGVDNSPDRPRSPDVAGKTAEDKLREDLGAEYYALLDVVTDYDQRLVTVKGWSVTLSLAALGLGFQEKHYALFGLAAFSAAAFWVIDALYKKHQVAYYSRMRDIEVASYYLNRVALPELGEMSAPRIDWYWNYPGHAGDDDPRYRDKDSGPPPPHPKDWRHRQPWRRTSPELLKLYRRP